MSIKFFRIMDAVTFRAKWKRFFFKVAEIAKDPSTADAKVKEWNLSIVGKHGVLLDDSKFKFAALGNAEVGVEFWGPRWTAKVCRKVGADPAVFERIIGDCAYCWALEEYYIACKRWKILRPDF